MSKKQKIIYGTQSITSALEQGKIIEQILYSEILPFEQKQKLIHAAEKHSTPAIAVSQPRLASQFGSLAGHGAVAVLSKIPFITWHELLHNALGKQDRLPLIIATDGVKDPGNVGTIIRTLDAANAAGFLSDNTCTVINNRLMRNASAGAIFTLPVARTSNLTETLQHARKAGFKIFATSSHDLGKKVSLYDLKFKEPAIVVLGSEEQGISGGTLELADRLVSIPQPGNVESLNVGVAAAIIIYEFLRQNL